MRQKYAQNLTNLEKGLTEEYGGLQNEFLKDFAEKMTDEEMLLLGSFVEKYLSYHSGSISSV